MLSLYLGTPGSGKSYEVTVFEVLPRLQEGRLVITNLPLNLDYLYAMDSSFRSLIRVLHAGAENRCPFSRVEDYDPIGVDGERWSHPVSGIGPLYVIDEAHKPLPADDTSRKVDEWFAEHRHLKADVVLITQDYTKIFKNIRRNADIVVCLKKLRALGAENRYSRVVKDDPRGKPIGPPQIRKYEPRYFKLYQSHTQTDRAGLEEKTRNVKSVWHHPIFKVLLVFFCFFIYKVSRLDVKALYTPKATTKAVSKPLPSSPSPLLSKPIVTPPKVALPPTQDLGPLGNVRLVVSGFFSIGSKSSGVYTVYRGDGWYDRYTSDDLRAMGYEITYDSECVHTLWYSSVSGVSKLHALCPSRRVYTPPVEVSSPPPVRRVSPPSLLSAGAKSAVLSASPVQSFQPRTTSFRASLSQPSD